VDGSEKDILKVVDLGLKMEEGGFVGIEEAIRTMNSRAMF